jgi:CheY-like chemotaxis protein
MKTVFVIDDDRDTVKFYSTFFMLYGLDVMAVAYSGDEALEKYHTLHAKPDIILLDHRMPGKDGLQVAREILSCDPEVHIIMASADENAKEEALRIGIRSFQQKPVDINDILDSINELT